MRLSLFVLGACMTVPALAQPTGAAASLNAACGAMDQTFKATNHAADGNNAPASGEAQLYITEVQDRTVPCLGSCSVTVKVGVDGKWAGATTANSYMALPMDPGQHHLCVAWQSGLSAKHKLELAGIDAQSGKTYYFRVHVVPPTTETTAQFELQTIDADEGKLLVASSPMSAWTVVK